MSQEDLSLESSASEGSEICAARSANSQPFGKDASVDRCAVTSHSTDNNGNEPFRIDVSVTKEGACGERNDS
eukprot:7507962-Ditylum_brightwellii.AAC.1